MVKRRAERRERARYRSINNKRAFRLTPHEFSKGVSRREGDWIATETRKSCFLPLDYIYNQQLHYLQWMRKGGVLNFLEKFGNGRCSG
jgi:hypothetical protein